MIIILNKITVTYGSKIYLTFLITPKINVRTRIVDSKLTIYIYQCSKRTTHQIAGILNRTQWHSGTQDMLWVYIFGYGRFNSPHCRLLKKLHVSPNFVIALNYHWDIFIFSPFNYIFPLWATFLYDFGKYCIQR